MKPACRLVLLPLFVLMGVGCDWDYERMIDQPKHEAYEPSPFFDDGKTLQAAPKHTVSRGTELGPEPYIHGTQRGQPVTQLPVDVDRQLVARGRDRFDIFCATCHGLTGDGTSPVASRMVLRKPPSLVAPPVIDYPVGRIYQAISEGYGLMPSLAYPLSIDDRWAVVAYLGALQLSQSTKLDELPPRLRREARGAMSHELAKEVGP